MNVNPSMNHNYYVRFAATRDFAVNELPQSTLQGLKKEEVKSILRCYGDENFDYRDGLTPGSYYIIGHSHCDVSVELIREMKIEEIYTLMEKIAGDIEYYKSILKPLKPMNEENIARIRILTTEIGKDKAALKLIEIQLSHLIKAPQN